jgi:hypothetical protein
MAILPAAKDALSAAKAAAFPHRPVMIDMG